MPQAVTHFGTHLDTFPPHSGAQLFLGFFPVCVGAALGKIMAHCAAAADDANCIARWDLHCYGILCSSLITHTDTTRDVSLPLYPVAANSHKQISVPKTEYPLCCKLDPYVAKKWKHPAGSNNTAETN
jgi:hypothetical protein